MDWFKKTLFTNRAQKVKKIENDLDPHLLPKHVAIIMDGNGRWAEKRGLPRALGHRAGVESLRKVIRLSSDLGIQVLTLYAFSTENWKRPTDEVRALMDLLVEYLDKEIDELHRNQVNIRVLGNIEPLPEKAKEKVLQAIEKTKNNTGLTVNIALNYGSRAEMIRAIKEIALQVSKGQLQLDDINEELFSKYLYTAHQPDPDLVIRSSGEYRISNFLLYQIAYSELWFTDVLWPEFNDETFLQALKDYQGRNRRYGGISTTGRNE